MALEFPSWWKGGFPDAEAVMRDLLLPFTSQVSPSPAILAWLPEDYEQHLPIVSLFRINGVADPGHGVTDRPHIQLGVMCGTRSESMELMEFCRQLVLTYRQGGRVKRADGSFTALKSAMEIEGPELTPERVPDIRLVYATFELETSRPLGAPNYQGVREDRVG